jgi:hypothetical protein
MEKNCKKAFYTEGVLCITFGCISAFFDKKLSNQTVLPTYENDFLAIYGVFM